ncbi:reverse transcriptase domain, reverse transcriptase zinc-binding domain protein [Tanacetum coccineum]
MASNVSWGWRKLLQIRSILRPHFWHELGNGRSTSAWFDTWDTQCPLMNLVSYRAVTGGGFNMQECVNDIISDGVWAWPSEWHNRYPTLNLINVPILNAQQVDKLQWKAYDGSLKDFSCREVWFTIRERGSETEWYYLVWSPYGIPRHAIHLWLVMKKRLKTQDRLRQWDVGNDVDLSLLRCPLCKSQQDSHEHLFFECAYSSSVWQNVLNVAGISMG